MTRYGNRCPRSPRPGPRLRPLPTVPPASQRRRLVGGGLVALAAAGVVAAGLGALPADATAAPVPKAAATSVDPSPSPSPTAAPVEQIINGGFDNGTSSWWSYSTTTGSFAVVEGRLCAEFPGGTKFVWDAGMGQSPFPLVAGRKYRLSYQATATPRMMGRVSVELSGEPYTGYYQDEPTLTEKPRTFTETFVARDSLDNAQLTFQFGADSITHTVCLDNVSLLAGV